MLNKPTERGKEKKDKNRRKRKRKRERERQRGEERKGRKHREKIWGLYNAPYDASL
jgi:hypothetical protein